MTIHRARLGHDLMQGARQDKLLTPLSIIIICWFALFAVGFLCVMVGYLWTAVQQRNATAWNAFWNQSGDIQVIGICALISPMVAAVLNADRLHERAARRFALLGDAHWAPVLDVQAAPLNQAELAQDSLDFGIVYAPKATFAISYVVCGVVLIAVGGGIAWLFIWLAHISLPVPPGYESLAIAAAVYISAVVSGALAWGIWLIWWGTHLKAGTRLLGDDAALHVQSRRGRARARIAWHEMHALAAHLPGTGSDRTTYYLDTGDRVLIWVESVFDESAARAQRALLRRAVTTRAGLPLRDVTLVYTHIPAAARDVYPWIRSARSARLQLDDAAPTETDRAIWQPVRALWRITKYLGIFGGAAFFAAVLVDLIAFVLQHLFGL